MAFVHGKNTNFKVGDVANTLRDLSTILNETSQSRDVDEHETSTFGVSDKTFEPGLREGTISLDGLFSRTEVAYLEGILGIAARTFNYSPEGTATGTRLYSGVGFLTSLEVGSEVGDMVSVSGEFRISGAITAGTNP